MEQQDLLHTAATKGYFEEIEVLLRDHLELDVSWTALNALPWHFAVKMAVNQVFNCFLNDPRVDITLTNYNDKTPLWKASQEGHLSVIERPVASGRGLTRKGGRLEWVTLPLKWQESNIMRRWLCCWKDSWPIPN